MEDTTFSCDYPRQISTACPDCDHKFVCNDQNVILGNERYEVVYRQILSEGQRVVLNDSDGPAATRGNVLG